MSLWNKNFSLNINVFWEEYSAEPHELPTTEILEVSIRIPVQSSSGRHEFLQKGRIREAGQEYGERK